MATKVHFHTYRLGTIAVSILLIFCIFASGGCSAGAAITSPPAVTLSPTATAPLGYVNNPLPTWTGGKFNAALLQASGGISPYSWTLKEGSALPDGFTLYTDGKFTGTPPLLSAGTTQFITPPFTIILSDSAGNQVEVELNISIVQPEAAVSTNHT